MSDQEKPVSSLPRSPESAWKLKSSNKSQKLGVSPESPTTARELDFEDEPQDTSASPPKKLSTSSIQPPVSGQELPPPKPPRPLTPNQQAENTLKEAFPSIDAAVVKAVLRASGGSVEPAFNALLGQNGRYWFVY